MAIVRRRLGLSTRELSLVLGCSPESLYRWERAGAPDPKALLGQVFRALAVRLEELDDGAARAWGDRIRASIALAPLERVRALVVEPERSQWALVVVTRVRDATHGRRHDVAILRVRARDVLSMVHALTHMLRDRTWIEIYEDDSKLSVASVDVGAAE